MRHVPVHLIQQQPGACSAERQCWCIWKAAKIRSAVLTRPLRSTRACSVGENAIGHTLLRASGCTMVSNVSLVGTFLVPVLERTSNTLMTVLNSWGEPGTTVISDCWAAYRDLDAQSYMRRTVNHTISFVNGGGGSHQHRWVTLVQSWTGCPVHEIPSPCRVHGLVIVCRRPHLATSINLWYPVPVPMMHCMTCHGLPYRVVR
jgi:hypothetical protein